MTGATLAISLGVILLGLGWLTEDGWPMITLGALLIVAGGLA